MKFDVVLRGPPVPAQAVIITDPELAQQVLSRESGLEKTHNRYKSPVDLVRPVSEHALASIWQ